MTVAAVGQQAFGAEDGPMSGAFGRERVSPTRQHATQRVADIRLDQARAWLLSNRELRSQTQIAAALGFASTTAFGRGYRRRFGETVGETRRRVVNDSELLAVALQHDDM